MIRHPLAVIEPGAAGRDALRLAISLAQESNGRLSCVRASRCCFPCWTVPLMVGIVATDPGAEQRLMAAACDEVPADIPLQTQFVSGTDRIERQVLVVARHMRCDAIVVSEAAAWLKWRLGWPPYLVRHSWIPVLVAEHSRVPARNIT